MQRKIANKLQTIHYQLTGPKTASRLECPSLLSRPLSYPSVYRIFRTIPRSCDL